MENLKNGLRFCVVLVLLGVMMLASCTIGTAYEATPEEDIPFTFGTLDREEFDRLVQGYMDFYGNILCPISEGVEQIAPRLRYMGTYSDNVVFLRTGSGSRPLGLNVRIGGVLFTNNTFSLMIYLWRDGRVYPLMSNFPPAPNAYTKGFLTQEDLESIADKWHNRPMHYR